MPGLPPRPEALLAARPLQQRIKNEDMGARCAAGHVNMATAAALSPSWSGWPVE